MKVKTIFLLFVIFLVIGPGISRGENYTRDVKQLMQKGFPLDYAKPLAALQRKHPKWEFVPLLVTKLEPKYTWAFVLEQETTASPSRSLISSGEKCAPYFHKTDTKQYDAGCRRASTEAVAFFLDPRNFLNERDIFQFEDLRDARHVSLEAVKATLKGTFLENGTVENGKSYAECFLWLGKKLKVSPLHLATRVRLEQGVSGTPLISGKCGTLLWNYYQGKVQQEGRYAVLAPDSGFTQKDLLAFDGLYNFYNQEAAGNGRFTIYLNGMREAVKGTPEMAKQWKSPRWDTKWKALYGGALKVAAKYVGNYQNTAYLQKWNVDPRCKSPKGGSRNFWGQYMQDIGAAFGEGVTKYKARCDLGILDQQMRFQIPVYADMPKQVSPDPADGKCVWYPPFVEENKKKGK